MKKGLWLYLFFFSILCTTEAIALELGKGKKEEYFVSTAFTSEIVQKIGLEKCLEREVGDNVTSGNVKDITDGSVFVNGFTFGVGRMFNNMALTAYLSHSAKELPQNTLQLSDGMKITNNSIGISVVKYLSNMKVRPFFGVAVDIVSTEYVLSDIKSFDENWKLTDSKITKINDSWERLSGTQMVFHIRDTEGRETKCDTVCLAASSGNTCDGSNTPVSYVAFKNKATSLVSDNELRTASGMKLGFSVTGGLSFRVNNVMMEGFVAANLKPKLEFSERAMYVDSSMKDAITNNFMSYNGMRSAFADKYVYVQQNNVCTIPEPNKSCSGDANSMMGGVDAFNGATVDGEAQSSYVYTNVISYNRYNNLIRTYIPQEIANKLTYTLGIRALLLF
ncbi:hypothetical protein [Candidatus Fokinia crypta]|uniref:Uncharacterized protein n=1 Tax=Candidatus Fokinia crypta TaxID=1920990 RepID=A0ABZ0USR9_9RICK|nr:hypothetical protein [Candidatus Fokinia cryptica]WPX97738.1 hypothetical protein Fokcrypt_00253 [Candidatus Fokinia cryptica]